MANGTSKRQSKTLQNLEGEKQFWLCSGQQLSNLTELVCALETMSDDIFNYHVNESKNDFSSWILDCFQDKTLATAIMKIPSRQKSALKIKSYLDKIQNAPVKTASTKTKTTAVAAAKVKTTSTKKTTAKKTTKATTTKKK